MHGLAKICAVGMFVYFFMQIIIFVHQQNYAYIASPMGYWFLFEMLGFVLLPMILFFISYRSYNITLIKIAGVLALLGIILNRMNISIIAFQWESAVRYVPTWQEFIVTLTIIFTEIWVLRWIITRMPVLRKSPDWVKDDH